MRSRITIWIAGAALFTVAASVTAQRSPSGPVQRIDLAERLTAGKLRVVNRDVTKLPDKPGAIHASEGTDLGLVWIDGTDFAEGTIEVDLRGRDVQQRSFVGIAFHAKDDKTYESVYLRPFNFRSTDETRRQHAVQYMSVPEFDWQMLRQKFPEEFENPVDSSLDPTGWVPLRVVVKGSAVQIYAGAAQTPALEVRKLGQLQRGIIGLWIGAGSDGDFANLRITPAQ
jgi:hypothetical protein